MTRVDRAARVIDAPPERVYAALTERDALAEWLAPTGMSARFEHFDARPGGSYRLVLTYDDSRATHGKATGTADIVEVQFTELVPARRVVQAVEFESDDPEFAGTMTMTWELRDLGTGTEVRIAATDVPAGITPEDHAAGMESSLANLASFLEQPATPPAFDS